MFVFQQRAYWVSGAACVCSSHCQPVWPLPAYTSWSIDLTRHSPYQSWVCPQLTMRSLAIYLLQQKIKKLISRIWTGAWLLHLLFLSTITDLLVSFSMSICLSKFFQAQLIKQGVVSNMDFATISIILLLLQQNRSQQVCKDKEEEKLHGNSTCAQSGYRWRFCPESSHKVTSHWKSQIWYINTAWLNCQ